MNKKKLYMDEYRNNYFLIYTYTKIYIYIYIYVHIDTYTIRCIILHYTVLHNMLFAFQRKRRKDHHFSKCKLDFLDIVPFLISLIFCMLLCIYISSVYSVAKCINSSCIKMTWALNLLPSFLLRRFFFSLIILFFDLNTRIKGSLCPEMHGFASGDKNSKRANPKRICGMANFLGTGLSE